MPTETNEPKTATLTGVAVASFTGTMTPSTITWASIIYLRAARRFSETATRLDDPSRLQGVPDGEQRAALIEELVNASLATVMIANSAIEASINELFLESSLVEPGGLFKGMPANASKLLHALWEHRLEWESVLAKCQVAAAVLGRPPLPTGGGATQQLVALIELRNALVHHKPVSVEHGKSSAQSDDKIERRISPFFAPSNLADATHPFRWNRCLGAGCARWAYNTAVSFQKEFFAHLGVDYPR
jgi:hypothetical protein